MCLKSIVIQLLHQSATVDDPDPRRQPIDFPEDVAGHEDRDTFISRQTAKQITDLDDAGRIQPIGRLIEDQQLRRRKERTRESQTLQVAQRQRAGSSISVWVKCQSLDDVIHLGRVGHPRQTTRDVEVLADGEFLVGGRRLDEVAHSPPPISGSTVDPLAERLRVPGGRLPAPLRPRNA